MKQLRCPKCGEIVPRADLCECGAILTDLVKDEEDQRLQAESVKTETALVPNPTPPPIAQQKLPTELIWVIGVGVTGVVVFIGFAINAESSSAVSGLFGGIFVGFAISGFVGVLGFIIGFVFGKAGGVGVVVFIIGFIGVVDGSSGGFVVLLGIFIGIVFFGGVGEDRKGTP